MSERQPGQLGQAARIIRGAVAVAMDNAMPSASEDLAAEALLAVAAVEFVATGRSEDEFVDTARAFFRASTAGAEMEVIDRAVGGRVS
jgi:hypothetical protein